MIAALLHPIGAARAQAATRHLNASDAGQDRHQPESDHQFANARPSTIVAA